MSKLGGVDKKTTSLLLRPLGFRDLEVKLTYILKSLMYELGTLGVFG